MVSSAYGQMCKAAHLQDFLAREEIPPLTDPGLIEFIEGLQRRKINEGIADLRMSCVERVVGTEAHVAGILEIKSKINKVKSAWHTLPRSIKLSL